MTEWWAFKPITTAFEKTRKLLLEPFDAWTWLKLIIIVFFLGGGAGSRLGNGFNYRAGPSDTRAFEQGISSALSNTTVILIILGLVILLIALALLFAYLRNVFSFVFIRALTSGDVHVIKPFMDNLGRGFRLFIFTLAVGLLTLAAIVGLILLILLCVFLVTSVGTSGVAGILVLLLAIVAIVILSMLMIAFAIAMAIFVGFTYDFVAPMVYFKGLGVVEAWRRLWDSIRKDWQQYGVYILTRWALELAVGIPLLFIALPLALIFIAVLALGAFVALAAAKTSILLAVPIGLALLAILAVFIAAMLVISMPISVFFRYFSLDFLKEADPSAVAYSGRFTPSPPLLSA